MRKRTYAYIAAAAVVAASAITVTTVQAEEPGDPALAALLDTILDDDRYHGSTLGLVVADAKTGNILYGRDSDARVTPASNTKLFTSAAAMDILGPDYTFTTDIATDGRKHRSVLDGDLYLRGTGDPTMLATDYNDLAASLAAEGITKINGDMIADDTAYDDSRLGFGWSWDDEGYYYSAEISALTVAPDTDYDAGTLVATASPGESEGDPVIVTLEPATDHVTIESSATTTAADTDPAVSIYREHGTNTIKISGTLPIDGNNASEWIAVGDPTGYAADVFAKALADNGISFDGDIRTGKATPKRAKSLASHESMPLSELLVPFMKLSNNGHAESLVKAVGREVAGQGTWDAGIEAIVSKLAEYGVDSSGIEQADGSGLSRMNLFSANDIAGFLSHVRTASWFDTWYDSLPIACATDRFEGGTLRSRMCDTPAELNLHAKTGSMTAVSGLSGYVTTADGQELVFSMVSNDYVASSVKDLEDNVAIALAGYTTGQEEPKMSLMREPAPNVDSSIECSWMKPVSC